MLRVEGGLALLDDTLVQADVAIAGGVICDEFGPGGIRFDAAGLLVLPGIVDLHGDAFERQMQPRPGVPFPTALALADTEAQLLANGITTAFHAVTLSWEPGLRSPAAWRAMLDGLAARAWSCDMRVHMRWEEHNLDALDQAVADIEAGRVHLLSFNDHTPSILRKLATPAGAAKYGERAMIPAQELRCMAEAALARQAEVRPSNARIAAAARTAGIAVASHDDDTVETRARYRALGATICEFPMAELVAADARAAGEAVVMGSPNVVRGGSHLNWASAASLAERGLCTVLVSDYYYPALAKAALMLAKGTLGFAAAWSLISRSPAAAAGLQDRGRIAPGLRGDLVIIEPETGSVVATIVAGDVVYASRMGVLRLTSGVAERSDGGFARRRYAGQPGAVAGSVLE